MNLQFLISRYDRELDRKDKLTAAVALPVSIVAALGGMVAAMARGFSYQPGRLSTAFMVALSVYVAATAVCLYWLARNYAGSAYQYLPRLADLETFRRDVEDAGETGAVFDDELRSSIIKAADANTAVNDTRTAFIDRANQTLIAVLVATAFCGGLYVVDQIFQG